MGKFNSLYLMVFKLTNVRWKSLFLRDEGSISWKLESVTIS